MSQLQKYEPVQNDLEHFKVLAAIMRKSGAASKEMTEEMMLNIMLTAKDFGISPMKAVNGAFYLVKGKITMSTGLMVDRIRSAGHSVKVVEWNKEKCVIIGIRKDNADSVKVEYTWEDAQLAGLTGGDSWRKYPKDMLYNRAMSRVARVLFPDVVGNCYSEDEAWDIRGEKQPSTYEDEGAIPVEISQPAADSDLERVRALIEQRGIPTGELEGYVKFLAETKQTTEAEVVQTILSLEPELFAKFSVAYAKKVAAANAVDVAA